MFATTSIREVPFPADACGLFQRLTREEEHSIFLESMDGDGRNNVQSLLFVKNALVVEAHGQEVTLRAATAQGHQALAALEPALRRLAEVTAEPGKLVARFPAPLRQGSDRQRLTAPSTANALRLLCQGWGRQGATQIPLHLPGVFAYDFIEQFEDLPPAHADLSHFPDFLFFLPEELVIVNHEDQRAILVVHRYHDGTHLSGIDDAAAGMSRLVDAVRLAKLSSTCEPGCLPGGQRIPLDDEVDLDDAAYAQLVETVKRHIVAGDVFQIVPSRTFRMSCPDPWRAYRVLRRLNPSPYLFFLRAEGLALFGSSPETCVRVRGMPPEVEISPIAGTRPRGRTPEGDIDPDLDNRLEAELKLDEKELAEHMMLVDLARNDVARISRAGTRRVKRLLEVERYSHVMHLSSTVAGELRGELDALHAYVASANMGTLVGAPKIEAATLLRRYEADRRGPYGGAVGYFCSDGTFDTAIVIRSALVREGVATVRAGAGVVYDSDPLAEARETRAKASAVLRAIQLAKEPPGRKVKP